MKTKPASHPRIPSRLLATTLAGLLGAAYLSEANAANPTSGSLTATTATPVTWVGTATGTGSPGEKTQGQSSCVDGVNCDVFTLNVGGAPEDYAGKVITVTISWSVPTNDYDLFIHKRAVDGPNTSAAPNAGAPQTSETAIIDPNVTGTGVYVMHVVYFATTPTDQYRGSASVTAPPPAPSPAPSATPRRTATYISGGIEFSPSVPLKAPVTGRDGEPSSRTDVNGNVYVGGIRGFPAGVDLWNLDLNPASPNFDPNMRVPAYRGQPDAFSPTNQSDLGGDGGGDIDLAVGFGVATGKTDPTLAFSSLIAANISTGNSFDRGKTYNKNPSGNTTGGVSVDDRQWEEFLGTTSVYLLYRTLAPAVTQIQRSDDGGFTFGAAKTGGTVSQVGGIDVHQASGTVYYSAQSSSKNGVIGIGIPSTPKAEPLTYTQKTVVTDPQGVAHLFFLVKVADDGTTNGTVYACYSNENEILLIHSTDKGATWSAPVRVNDIATTGTRVNIFPAIETGPTPGSVGIAWYGTSEYVNDDPAEWKVYYAQSFDASSATPTFRIAQVTEPEHVIHASNISEGGLTGAANRNLIDYFQLSFDPQGAAVIAYADDHNDFDGHTYVSRQISGPSIKDSGAALGPQTESSSLRLPAGTAAVAAEDAFPPRQPGLNGEQVTDYPLDVQDGLLARVRGADPFDIVSQRYDTSGTGSTLAIAASMRVSDLSTIPPDGTWQMNFAVNAPHSVLSPTGTYTFGASDHSDQFYLQADTDSAGAPTFTYGKAVRTSSGGITYTQLGTADTGAFNSASGTISVQVSVAKLNAALPASSAKITNGTVVTGLRGRAITAANPGTTRAHNDLTRGGTQFVVHDSAFPAPAPAPTATPLPSPAGNPSPTPPNVDLANISTRVSVGTLNNVGIAGFIVRTTKPKRLLVRGIGPSLSVSGTPLTGTLQDPVLEIRNEAGALIASNDNWRSSQQAEITASGLAPIDDREAAVILNVKGTASSNNFTATIRGASSTSGIGLVEIYDIDAGSFADLGNLSTRGLVGSNNDVLIGGLIVRDSSGRNASQDILLRGIGPTLTGSGVTNPLGDPAIDLVDAQGNSIESNDDWMMSAEVAQIMATGAQPKSPKEAAIRRVLAPGAYTVILRAADGVSGVGLVEAYNLGNQ